MEKILNMIASFYAGMYERDETEDVGAGIVEYALLVALIAVACVLAVGAFGTELSNFFDGLGGAIGL